jgi:UDP-3-O-[3-hydroxymyristoyl] glucosamine N-acyltransferase
MPEPRFFERHRGLTVGDIADMTGAAPRNGVARDYVIRGIAPLDLAGPSDLAYIDSPRYRSVLPRTQAGACLMSEQFAPDAPDGLMVLLTPDPYAGFIAVARKLYPEALTPSSVFESDGVDAGAFVHHSARIEPGVIVDPGAVIGPRAAIGRGTVIGATAVIGPDVQIGRKCSIGPGASIMHALIGDNVIVHPGCRIGQDGFRYQSTHHGHTKVPQIGRVIIQDAVEIGAGSTIDRGGGGDTVVGEGTKIDNLVQIGHNVTIGRHCIIVAQCGLSGSVVLGDHVVLGGQVGIADHLEIGEGAMIGAKSGVVSSVPAGEKWLGFPARPGKDYFRMTAVLLRAVRAKKL